MQEKSRAENSALLIASLKFWYEKTTVQVHRGLQVNQK